MSLQPVGVSGLVARRGWLCWSSIFYFVCPKSLRDLSPLFLARREMESTNGSAPQPAAKSLATEGRTRLRSSSKNVSKGVSASLSSSPGTVGTLAGVMKERERSGSVDKEKKDKVKKEKKKKEKKEAPSAAPSLLYFSTSTVPTVTHPELPSQLDKVRLPLPNYQDFFQF